MIRSLLIAATCSLTFTFSAGATVLDLSSHSFENGEKLTNQISGLTVSAIANGGGRTNDFAIIFDTENAIGDGDLAAAFDDPSTPFNEATRPGNILAIGETCGRGNTCEVDDNATGGVINLTFDRDVVFNSLSLFDLRTNELTITLRDAMDNIVFAITGPNFNTDTNNNRNNNLFTTLSFDGITFRTAEFLFSGSGAIGNFDISEVPLPGALPLFFAGLAGMMFARRQRR